MSSSESGEEGWEVRPGGMLVQTTRSSDLGGRGARNVRLRISYGSARYEVTIGSQATFGHLKKLLSSQTGLQPGEQRLLYKGKERVNSEFLDMCGVKDRSKLALLEDLSSLERRNLEMQKNAKIQSIHRAISTVSLEVDKLANQVTIIEKTISEGNKVAEVQITTLIELLMRHAVKLDSIPLQRDAFSQKILQVSSLSNTKALRKIGTTSFEAKKVQKCVETLDALKISNARVNPVVVTTKWEFFD